MGEREGSPEILKPALHASYQHHDSKYSIGGSDRLCKNDFRLTFKNTFTTCCIALNFLQNPILKSPVFVSRYKNRASYARIFFGPALEEKNKSLIFMGIITVFGSHSL